MKKKTLRLVALGMLILAVAFVVFALNHPEMSFPWDNFITYTLYGAYVLIMMLLFITPGAKRD